MALGEAVEDNLRSLYLKEEPNNAIKNSGLEYKYMPVEEIIKNRKGIKIVDTEEIINEIRDEMDERLS